MNCSQIQLSLKLTVTLLQELVQQEDDQARDEELDDDQKTDAGSDVAGVAVHAGQDVHDGLAHRDHHPEQLLRSVEQRAVLGRVPDLDELGAGQQLHDEARGHDGRDAQLHEGSSVGGEDHTDPVEGIRGVRAHDAEQGDLKLDLTIFVCPTRKHIIVCSYLATY